MAAGSTASTIEASPEVFVEWYTQNMFTPMVTNTMNAGDPSANESYELAKKHNITPPQVDKIKKRFNEFDIDRGGTIDYEEFMQMLCFVLKAKSVRTSPRTEPRASGRKSILMDLAKSTSRSS